MCLFVLFVQGQMARRRDDPHVQRGVRRRAVRVLEGGVETEHDSS